MSDVGSLDSSGVHPYKTAEIRNPTSEIAIAASLHLERHPAAPAKIPKPIYSFTLNSRPTLPLTEIKKSTSSRKNKTGRQGLFLPCSYFPGFICTLKPTSGKKAISLPVNAVSSLPAGLFPLFPTPDGFSFSLMQQVQLFKF
jgi:hypothetical protein